MLQPEERTGEDRLVLAVHHDGVVGGGAAEIVAPGALRVVRESTGVDQERGATDTQREGERIGVAVRRNGEIPEWSRIGDDPDLLGSLEPVAQYVVAGARKRAAHRQPCARGIERLEARSGLIAEEPIGSCHRACRPSGESPGG